VWQVIALLLMLLLTTMLLLMMMMMLLYPLPINRSRFEDQLALRLQCRRDAAPARGYPIAR
jgi:hypothetical protein